MEKDRWNQMKEKALVFYEKAHIVLTQEERDNLEIADFGLNDFYHIGLSLVTYVNTELCCAKEMVLFPNQCCPEHTHAPLKNGYCGKEETFRCRYGRVYLYVEGGAPEELSARVPKGYEEFFTAFHEVVLNPGDQYTIYPNTKHWFVSGDEGAVISEFSTKSYDELDIFTDPNIKRIPTVE